MEWALEKGNLDLPDEGDDPRGHRRELRRYRLLAAEYVLFAEGVCEAGRVTLYRSVEVPRSRHWSRGVEMDQLGIYWSAERGGAGVYNRIDHGVPVREVLMVAVATPDSVDWEGGFRSFLAYGESEWEITLKPRRRVWLVEVDGEALARPLAGNTGSMKERKVARGAR